MLLGKCNGSRWENSLAKPTRSVERHAQILLGTVLYFCTFGRGVCNTSWRNSFISRPERISWSLWVGGQVTGARNFLSVRRANQKRKRSPNMPEERYAALLCSSFRETLRHIRLLALSPPPPPARRRCIRLLGVVFASLVHFEIEVIG